MYFLNHNQYPDHHNSIRICQGGDERKAEAYKESKGGRAWAGAKAKEKISGMQRARDCYAEAEAYAGAAAYKDGNHDALKESVGWFWDLFVSK